MLIGALGLIVSFVGLYLDVGFIAQPFYAWAWWSYIFFVDGWVAKRRGGSLLTTRRAHLPAIALWSITFWYFFELLNLRLQNWYYVGVFGTESGVDLVRSGIFGVLAFATVFVGLFETADALSAAGLWRGVTLRRRALSPWVSYAVQMLGVTMVSLALSFSYLAPLIWGSFSFLVDPWNYRRGARSLLAELETGRIGGVLRLLSAGLICGLVWESLNFLAPQKWIYTVRGLEELKLFEMPLLGFLGFPALALDAFAAFAAVSFLTRGNASWEHPDDVPVNSLRPTTRRSQAWLAATLPLHIAFWGVVSVLGQNVNIGSVELELAHLETLPPRSVTTLAEIGVHRPRQLLLRLRDSEKRAEVGRLLGVPSQRLAEIEDEIELLTFKGIGPHHGALLRELGWMRVADLRTADPRALYQELEAARSGTFPGLRLEMVRVWVNGAGAFPERTPGVGSSALSK